MPRAFLSHSSKQKQYVETVARKLGTLHCVYDSLTFEEGMKILEEIFRGLEDSDLFVIFLSDSALESNWVNNELTNAKSLLDQGKIKRIYPIIIDDKIDYKDLRIPDWMRDEYNLRYIGRPTIAARRIQQRLREIVWNIYPTIEKKEQIFIGRNSLVQAFEERIYRHDQPSPVCIIASGIPSVGRRSLLTHCLQKANIVRKSYTPNSVVLNSRESIEDLILKVYDLGFSSAMAIENLLSKKIDEKVEIAVQLFTEVYKSKELLFIIDHGCIVRPDGEMSQWSKRLFILLENKIKLGIINISKYRVKKSSIFDKSFVFSIEVPELDIGDRKRLFTKYLELDNISLLEEDYEYFSGLFKGFPEQIHYTVDMIKNEGLNKAKDNTHLIVDFNEEKALRVLQKYVSDTRAFEFLQLLSEFDFVSFNFIFDIVGSDSSYKMLLREFLSCAICELIGGAKEYIRLNDTIADFVQRKNIEIRQDFRIRINEHIHNFLSSYQTEERDVSDFLFSIKEALIAGNTIPDRYLIPSHFLKTMTELYEKKKEYDDVITLADRALSHSLYMDVIMQNEIRYWLCLSLARLRNQRFLDEVQKINGPDHNFLLGFYYRLVGNNEKAIEQLTRALAGRQNFSRAKRELVQVYLSMEEYDTAFELAKENYENDRSNPYHIQGYLRCLIKRNQKEDKTILEELLKNLNVIGTEKSMEMYFNAEAQYYAFYLNREDEAIEIIDRAIESYSDSIYLKFTKFDICEKNRNIPEMENVLRTIEQSHGQSKKYHHNTIVANKAKLIAIKGDKIGATHYLVSNLRHIPGSSMEKLKQRILE